MRTPRLLPGLALLFAAACGGGNSAGVPVETLSSDTVAPLNASSPEFQNAGESIRAEKGMNPAILSQMEPFITDSIDIEEPAVYRIRIQLPPGTDTSDVSFMGPGDTEDFMMMSIGIDPEATVVQDGVAHVVLNVVEVYEPYPQFQLWVQ